MAKKLAEKTTRVLRTEAEIKELGLNISNYTSSWQGRVFISDAANSMIAEKINIKEKGEYAIKVR